MISKNKRKPKRIRRRSNTTFTLLAVGVAGILAVLALAGKPSPVQSTAPDQTLRVVDEHDTVLIPVPSRPVARGEKLADITFSNIKWPKSRLSGQYITELDPYRQSIARTALPQYLPIPTSAVTSNAIDGNIVVEGIPEGMRAITVRVDAEAAIEGWARSGNFVDVMLIRAAKDKTGLETLIIAENVKILSAGRSAAPMEASSTAPKAPATVTLLVSQEEMMRIKTATKLGKLTFALRGEGDEFPAEVVKMDQRTVLGEARPAKGTHFKDAYVRDSKGRVYVLDSNSKWVRTSMKPSSFDIREVDEE